MDLFSILSTAKHCQLRFQEVAIFSIFAMKFFMLFNNNSFCCLVGHFAIGLVFKPISGTIDLIGKSSEFKKDHVIHQNVFKVFKVF